jgi:hypothetical protein
VGNPPYAKVDLLSTLAKQTGRHAQSVADLVRMVEKLKSSSEPRPF